MSSVNHYDVVGKALWCLSQSIIMVCWRHYEDFFSSSKWVFSFITMSSVKHHDDSGKTSWWFGKEIAMFDWRHRDDFFFKPEKHTPSGEFYTYVSPFIRPLKPSPRAGSRVKRTRFTLLSPCFHRRPPPVPPRLPHPNRWNETTRVKRTRFTLNPALEASFRGLVKGESRFEKPHCRDYFIRYQLNSIL
jgi:hypothetical protein